MLNANLDMTDVLMTFGKDEKDTTICAVYADSKEVYRVKNGVVEYVIIIDQDKPFDITEYEKLTDHQFKMEDDRQRLEALDQAEAWDEQKLVDRDGDWAGAR